MDAESRDRLEQELLELHFGCHEAPEELQRRIDADPELQALQREVVRTAAVLREAVQPAAPPLEFPVAHGGEPIGAQRESGGEPGANGPDTRSGNGRESGSTLRWWRRPWSRVGAVAAAAAIVVAASGVAWGIAAWRHGAERARQCHLTVSAPQAVPAGAPWSFTIESFDLDGEPRDSAVHWRVLAADGTEIAAGEPTVRGRSVVAMTAGMVPPQRLEVRARRPGTLGSGTGAGAAAGASGTLAETVHVLPFAQHAASPLVHVATDRPVYRPGEVVLARAVVLERATLQPSLHAPAMRARVLDPKGTPLADLGWIALAPAPAVGPPGPAHPGVAAAAPAQGQGAAGAAATTAADLGPSGTGAVVWQVPVGVPGGEFQLEIQADDNSFPPERTPFVVRDYRDPQLATDIVLDRKTYAPGTTGSALVTCERLGGGAAAGAQLRAALVLDGAEVWQQDLLLDGEGRATVRFAVPATVERGAARLVARVTDGGAVETEVEPFVVPTGKVRAAAFPEGGALVAGVQNRVYVEIVDRLDRAVDTGGAVVDGDGRRVATFTTAHQGRARFEFVPEAGASYRLQVPGLDEPLALPAVEPRGIALRVEPVAANEPLRARLAGRGDGPWVVGAFCRGVLLAQTTVRPEDGRDAIDREVALELPTAAAGVLRVTVFDRALQPVAERLVQRLPAQQVHVALASEHATRTPGQAQTVRVRTTDETGAPVRAFVGLTVVDGGALAQGDEEPISLLDQALLFADCERLEDVRDFFAGGEHALRNVDLVLGTRGWRRFVWKNDDAAQAAIAGVDGGAKEWAANQLAREGFAQRPQVASDRSGTASAMAGFARSERRAWQRLGDATGLGLLALLLWLAGEGAWSLRRPVQYRIDYVSRTAGALVAAGLLVLLLMPGQLEMAGRAGPDAAAVEAAAEGELLFDFAQAKPGEPVALRQVADPRLFDLTVTGADEFFLGAAPRAVRVERLDVGLVRRFADLDADADPPAVFLGLGADKLGEQIIGYRGPADFVPPQANARALRQLAGAGGGFGGPWTGGRGGQPLRVYAHRHQPTDTRRDFTPTIAWHPLLATDGEGNASFAFDTSDAVTTWRVRADAHGQGRVGSGAATFTSQLPFRVEAKLPLEVSAGDRLRIPVAVERTAGDAATATVTVELAGPIALASPARVEVPLQQGRGRCLVELTVADDTGIAAVAVAATAGGFTDRVLRRIPVAPRGFPVRRSQAGTLTAGVDVPLPIAIPAAAVPGSGSVRLRLFPSPLAGVAAGLQGILQEPHGCFEQASSSNYPNVMVLALLEANGDDIPAVAARARELLPKGYAKITGYECKERGYEWFGGDPGHEALTAYGLLQFHDMAKVFDVDSAMVQRTRQWLLGRRDGEGGYRRNERALDRFGAAPPATTNAYVTYALLHSGTPAAELGREIDALAARARTTADGYELALAANALHLAGHDGAAAARARLCDLQREDGAVPGAASITRSGGDDLLVETTAFAVLAWLAGDEADAGAAARAVQFLQTKKGARGTFGATQATICALRALTAYANKHRAMPAPGTLRVRLGGQVLGEAAFAAGQAEAIELELWGKLPPGEHVLTLSLEGGGTTPLPWACDVAYHADLPADDPDAKVTIATRLLADRVEEGRTVACEVLVENRTAEGQPMTLAVIGLPAGLELPTKVLDDLQDAGAFDLWEIHGREIALYWRSLAPSAQHRVRLDLLATVPGTTSGPASRAALYYTPKGLRWASPLQVTVTPSGE